MLIVVASRWSFASANTHDHSNVTAWPLIDASLVQGERTWVVFSSAFVDKHRLADLDRLKCQSRG
jgi:hypothetical protein